MKRTMHYASSLNMVTWIWNIQEIEELRRIGKSRVNILALLVAWQDEKIMAMATTRAMSIRTLSVPLLSGAMVTKAMEDEEI